MAETNYTREELEAMLGEAFALITMAIGRISKLETHIAKITLEAEKRNKDLYVPKSLMSLIREDV